MDDDHARSLALRGRVARLATPGADGTPHLVPCVFAFVGNRFVTAIDWKPKAPKTTGDLVRVRNVRRAGTASAIVDHYDDADWSALWWVRLSGPARVVEPGTTEHAQVVAALVVRYDQYRDRPPEGPAIVIDVTEWRSWSAAG
jgi:PPOX class probable F420-dependent enzyme